MQGDRLCHLCHRTLSVWAGLFLRLIYFVTVSLCSEGINLKQLTQQPSYKSIIVSTLTWNPLMIAKAYTNTMVPLFKANRPRIQPTPRIGMSTNSPLIPALHEKQNIIYLLNEQTACRHLRTILRWNPKLAWFNISNILIKENFAFLINMRGWRNNFFTIISIVTYLRLNHSCYLSACYSP